MATIKPAKQAVPPPEGVAVLKLEEAGYLLGRISPTSVRRLVDEGKLAAVRVTVGGSLRIERSEVERYLRSARFVARPASEPEPEATANAARAREAAKARVKADWNTGEDPFEERPRRKGRGVQ